VKAIVLCAGEGTRMRPLTENRPKVMVPAAGRPILDYVLEAVRAAGIRDVLLVVAPGQDVIAEHARASFPDVEFSVVVQKKRLGTANAVSLVEDLVDPPFAVLNGDIVFEGNPLREALKRHSETGRSVVVGARVEDVSRYGELELEGTRLKAVLEKSGERRPGLANAGIYVFGEEVFEALRETPLSQRKEYEITDTLNIMAPRWGVEVVVHGGFWTDVGYPWDLLRANEALLRGLEGEVRGRVWEGATLVGPVFVGEGTEILPGTFIQGPVRIGRNCRIGPNAYIRPYTSIGDNCHIGAAVEIKNSIIMSRTNVPHHNYVGDSIIGENCNLGAGTKIANLRLDGREIEVNFGGEIIRTGMRKLGAIMGDGVKTGINVSINVGTIIGGGTFIPPGAVVTGYVPPRSRLL